jgi:xylan 1,4-beta-xylosidase
MSNTRFVGWRAAFAGFALAGLVVAAAASAEEIVVNAGGPTTPLPHFWERMVGSGRAVLALRDDYRRDLRAVHEVTGAQYVRFHNIFADEVGVYTKDKKGNDVWNFSYVDQIYDGLLELGVKPFVELSFMPTKMSSDPNLKFGFWYGPNHAPPSSYARWDELIHRFAEHLVERYGIDEVSSWYFEVWNEPNIGFWAGMPHKSTYYELYEHTARALKAVNPRFRVGGPSTAQAAWVGEFLTYMAKKGVPVDFASTHVYANDTADNVFGTKEMIPREDMVCRATKKVHDEIAASPLPKTPFVMSEFNASYANEPDVTDSIYMGPWIAHMIRACAGTVDDMSYWSFSDVFEEQGVVKTPFYGGFGLVAERDIPKPAFNAFALLHRLGDAQLAVNSDSALATRRSDGGVTLALWNYAAPDGIGETYHGPSAGPRPLKHFSVRVDGVAPDAIVRLSRVDADHGNVVATFDRMGRPPFPSRQQIAALREAATLPPAEETHLSGGRIELEVPTHGLWLLEIAH